MTTTSPVRKGDIVAIERTLTTVYANYVSSSVRPEWLLATVSSASHDGIAKSVVLAGTTYSQKIEHMWGRPRVYTLAGKQDAAKALLASGASCWNSGEELKSAILAAA